MRRVARALAAWAGLLLAGAGPAAALAASTASAGRGILSLPLADTVEAGRLEMSLVLSGLADGPRRAVAGGPVGGALGFHERGEVIFALSMTPPEDRERAWAGIDPFLFGLKWRLVDEAARLPGLAGDLGLRTVRGGFDLLPRLALQKSYAPFVGVLSLGYDAALGAESAARRGLRTGIGAQGTFGAWRALLEVTARFSEPRGYGLSALHVRAGTTYEIGGGVQLLASIAGGLGSDAAALRFSFGVIFVTSDERAIDHDGDGVADLLDRCLFEPEDLDRIEDDDGCPDEAPAEVAEAEAPPRFTTPTPRFRMRVRSTWVRPSPASGEGPAEAQEAAP